MKLSVVDKNMADMLPLFEGDVYIPSLIRRLNTIFYKSKIRFSSTRVDAAFFKNHNVIVAGQYCPRFLDIPEHIIITLCFPKETKKPSITKKGAINLRMRIQRAIYHEYRHMAQQKSRRGHFNLQYKKPKKIDKRLKMKVSYYGMPDEVDAHAYETVVETMLGNLDINRLRQAHKVSWKECEAVYLYRMYFRKADPKIWKKFLKKVYKHGTKGV